MDVESRETLDEVVSRATNALNPIVEGVVTKLQAVIHSELGLFNENLQATLESLDGWTVTVQVPTITVRLNRPKR